MELRNLRALVEVARCGGFSAAAQVIRTTQSTVSKAILQLEHDCGIPLIERLGRGVRLTSAGEIVFRRATSILAERDDLLSELAELRGLQRGKLKLGLPVLAGGAVFAHLLAAFRKKYPGIELELHERGISRLEEDVRSGQIEIGAALLPVSEDFEWRLIREDSLVALLPPEHPLGGRAGVKLAEIGTAPVILLGEGFGTNAVIASGYRRRKLGITEAGRSGNLDFIIAMVAAGLGVAFIPRVVLASRDHRSVRAIPLEDEDMAWRLAVIWRRGRTLSPAAQRWIEMVLPRPPKDPKFP